MVHSNLGTSFGIRILIPIYGDRLMYQRNMLVFMGSDDDRVSVKVHIPRWQKEKWVAHAEQLDMSQSEFLRSMVQAGRRGFDFTESDADDEAGSTDATPGVDDLEMRVLEVLRGAGHLTWDELLAGVTDDIEDRLEHTLDTLQESNQIKYSGRNGGYTLIGDSDQ